MEKKLDGQVILVTGAGRGLGASFCHVVAAAGASVLALGRDATALVFRHLPRASGMIYFTSRYLSRQRRT